MMSADDFYRGSRFATLCLPVSIGVTANACVMHIERSATFVAALEARDEAWGYVSWVFQERRVTGAEADHIRRAIDVAWRDRVRALGVVTIAPFWEAAPCGRVDELHDAVARFVAARPRVGAGALMRRYKIGRRRASALLTGLCARRILLGATNWRQTIWLVNPNAWSELLRESRLHAELFKDMKP